MSSSVWNPTAGGSTVNANNTLQRQRFIAADGQTDFTLTEFSYVIGTGSTLVFYNGEMQTTPENYQELSATVIKLLFSCNAGDVVDIIGFTGVSAIIENVRLFNNTYEAVGGETDIPTSASYRAGTSSTALYRDGVRLVPGVDYTEVDGTNNLELTAPATAGEIYFSVVGQLVNDVGSDASLISYILPGIGGSSTTVADVLDSQNLVDFDALRSYTGKAKYVYITGLLAVAEPQKFIGTFRRIDGNTTSPDDNAITIIDALGRRWRRVYQGNVFAGWFGAIGDGLSHPLSEKFATLAEAQVRYPHATALTDEIDWAATQAGVNFVKVVSRRTPGSLVMDEGEFLFNQILTFDTIGIGFIGTEQEGRRQQGSDLGPCAIIWRGGASPMFRTSVSLMTFKNFAVRNEGTATDWLEMLVGSQHFIWDNLSFIGGSGGGGTHTNFSRSTIYSQGRHGYSAFRRCLIKTCAPVFLLSENNGSTGTTPVIFEDRCIFDSINTAFTLIKLVNSAADAVIIRNCTFNMQGPELTIFDNSTGTAQPVLSFVFESNEIDSQASMAAYRFFRWRNCTNIVFDNNVVNGGGLAEYCGDLINSSMVSCNGNEYKSFATNLFNPDATSTIVVGKNDRNTSSPAEFSVVTAGIPQQTYAATMQLDLRRVAGYKHGLFHIDVTDAAAYTIRVDTSLPQTVVPGQVFTVVIRNVTAGAINAGAFTTNMNTTGALTAPAAGFNRSYTFYWNGTRAIEVGRSAGDVANA